MSKTVVRRAVGTATIALIAFALTTSVSAETLESALAQAYNNNPQLNAQRASVRATDETVSQALSGYRPRISAGADTGIQQFDVTTQTLVGNVKTRETLHPRGGNISAVQTVFNGFRTGNQTRQAEASVFAAREALRNVEQSVLLDAVTAYMNVLRDSAILDLQRRNVEVLNEQLRQTRDRFNVGEVTRTDVAQAESRLAAARSQVFTAEANLKTSRAAYRRVVGVEPVNLRAGMPVDRLSPGTLEGAAARGHAEHPQVISAQFTVDAAQFAVKVAESQLSPTVTLEGNVQKRWDLSPGTIDQFTATGLTRLTVPIYQGGAEYSAIRQAKETLGQRRIELDFARDQVRALVVQAWGQLEATKAQIQAAQAQVNAAEVALNGVREEARVGQRTTLDVLNAQQELVNARVALVTAQRDRVVASFTLLSAVGGLSAERLRLAVSAYDSRVHYHQVRDKWIGTRVPDGK